MSRARPLTLLTLAVVLALGACAGFKQEPPQEWGPDAKLAWWLDAWYETQDEQGRRGPYGSDDGPPTDREREEYARGEDEADDDERPPQLTLAVVRAGIRRVSLEYPEHVDSLVANGALALSSGDSAAAEQWLDDALALDPGRTDAAVLRARIAAEAGNLPGAVRILRRTLIVRPDAPEVHEAFAGVLFLQGDLEGAREELDIATRLGGSTARIAYHRGLLAEREGQAPDAARWYRRAVDADPEFMAAWHRLVALEAAHEEGGAGS